MKLLPLFIEECVFFRCRPVCSVIVNFPESVCQLGVLCSTHMYDRCFLHDIRCFKGASWTSVAKSWFVIVAEGGEIFSFLPLNNILFHLAPCWSKNALFLAAVSFHDGQSRSCGLIVCCCTSWNSLSLQISEKGSQPLVRGIRGIVWRNRRRAKYSSIS